MKKLLLISLFLLPFSAFAEEARLNTADGWTLSADYKAPSMGKPCVLMAHGLGSSRGEWGGLIPVLEKKGMGWLALDIRGHGQSRTFKDGQRGYESFSENDWNAASGDFEAAYSFLKSTGCASVAFAGASIGANLAIKAAARRKSKPVALVLLSPGLDYHGVKPMADFIVLPEKLHILMAVSEADSYSMDSVLKLYERLAARPEQPLLLSVDKGHGVQMLDGDSAGGPELAARIADWLSNNAAPPPASAAKRKRR